MFSGPVLRSLNDQCHTSLVHPSGHHHRISLTTVHNGHADASPPGSPVHTRRVTRAQYEYPQVAQQTPGVVRQPLQRPSTTARSSTAARCRTSQASTSRGTSCPARRERAWARSRSPPGFLHPYRLRGADAAALVPRAVHGPHTAQLRPRESVYTQSSPGPYAWYGVSTVGNAYTPAIADANVNTNAYFLLPRLLPSPAAPSLDQVRSAHGFTKRTAAV